jgi:hypothetical protein
MGVTKFRPVELDLLNAFLQDWADGESSTRTKGQNNARNSLVRNVTSQFFERFPDRHPAADPSNQFTYKDEEYMEFKKVPFSLPSSYFELYRSGRIWRSGSATIPATKNERM